MTTPHPNADLLRDIADGRQTQEEILDGASRRFVNCSAKRALQMIAKGCAQFIRIKPETVLINGIECNAPMRVEPEMGSWYYTPTPTNEAKFTLWAWLNDASGQRLFAEGLCFATAEDAAAAARAMIAPLKLNGGEAGAALSTAAQPLTQAEQENQLCISSASCGQASTNESAFITSTQRSAGTFSASSERQSYRDSDGMPTERAVLEREWRRMKIALSATAAQPPAGWRMVPVEPTIGMCIAGDEARITGNDSARTPAVYRAMIAAAPKAEPAPPDYADAYQGRGRT